MPPVSSPTQTFPLETLSPGGKPPKGRLPTAGAGQSVFGVLQQASLPRLERARTIAGMFDGNPPYDQAKLRKRNEGWRANFNSLEGESRADSAKAPYYDLTTSVERYADCSTDITTPLADAERASDIRSDEFDRLLRGWPGFDWNMWQMLDDFIKFGRGFLWWPRTDSWQFKHLPWSKVLFPNGTTCDPEEWELFVVVHEWSVTRFYSFIADSAAATASGWEVDACYEAIRHAQPRDSKMYRDPLALQRALRDSDFAVAAQSSKVLAASIYVKEFDGTWSRMIIATPEENVRDGQTATPMSRAERDGRTTESAETLSRLTGPDATWLYNKRNVAKSLHELMTPFVYEVGDGSINAIRGLGQRIASLMSAKDRMRCEMVNNVFLRSSITLQAPTGGVQGKAGVLQLGPLTVLPPGFVAQPSTIFGDIEGAIAADQTLDRLADVNTGTYRPQFEKPTGNPESATAASIRYTQTTVLGNSAVNRFYKQLDRCYEETYRRAVADLPRSARDPGVKTALDFQARCILRGVVVEQLRDLVPGSIRAQRAIGNGSPVMRQQMTQELLPLLQTDLIGPRGRAALAHLYVAARGGQHLVDKIFPPEDTAQVPTRDQYDAVGENADMQTGGQVLIAAWQDHFTHIMVHAQGGVGAAQAVQQGADPAHAFTYIQSALPHVQQHLASIRDPIRQKQAAQMVQQLEAASKIVEQAAQEQAQQQGQQQQLTFEQGIAMQTAQHDAKLKEFKAQHSAQLKAQVSAQKTQLDVAQATHASQLADATTAAAIQRETATVANQVTNARAETAAKVEAERMKAAAAADAARNKPKSDSK